MPDDPKPALAATEDMPDIVRKIRARTPARLLVGRTGAAYRTSTQMDLREAHATARDAVRAELETDQVFGANFEREWNLLDVRTQATTKDEYVSAFRHEPFGGGEPHSRSTAGDDGNFVLKLSHGRSRWI